MAKSTNKDKNNQLLKKITTLDFNFHKINSIVSNGGVPCNPPPPDIKVVFINKKGPENREV